MNSCVILAGNVIDNNREPLLVTAITGVKLLPINNYNNYDKLVN